MHGNARGRRAASLVVVSLALPGVLHGCSSPTAPVVPPGGGQTLHLSYAEFARNVEPLLIAHGCDATGDCHGGGIRGTLELSPPTAKDTLFDFHQVALQTSAAQPDSSPILTMPLVGGPPHAGGKPFLSTSNPDYQAIRQWVMDGVQP